jgi:hypothetical protein
MVGVDESESFPLYITVLTGNARNPIRPEGGPLLLPSSDG